MKTNKPYWMNFPVEPAGKITFGDWNKLYRHTLKHVCCTEEEWRKLDGFEAKMIREAKKGEPKNNDALRFLALKYQKYICNLLIQAGEKGYAHLHELAEYTPTYMKLLGKSDPESEQFIKFWDFERNLIIIAFLSVTNGTPDVYKIKTAYRYFDAMTLSDCVKSEKQRLEERSNIHRNKQFSLLADHMTSNSINIKE